MTTKLATVDRDLLTFFGIIGYVVSVAWLSRHVALDMDRRGWAGWAYGIMTFVVPPLGVALWLVDRNRASSIAHRLPELGTVGDVVVFLLFLVTFPWGLLVWLFLTRRASTHH